MFCKLTKRETDHIPPPSAETKILVLCFHFARVIQQLLHATCHFMLFAG